MVQALILSVVLAMIAIGGHVKAFDGSGGPPQHATVVSASPAPLADGSGGPPQH